MFRSWSSEHLSHVVERRFRLPLAIPQQAMVHAPAERDLANSLRSILNGPVESISDVGIDIHNQATSDATTRFLPVSMKLGTTPCQSVGDPAKRCAGLSAPAPRPAALAAGTSKYCRPSVSYITGDPAKSPANRDAHS